MYVSIVITTYNAEKFILSALNAILNQTHTSYEVIIIDDGSLDNSVKIMQKFITTNNLFNFKLLAIKHVGRAKALEYGVLNAQYEWLAISDADDLWHQHKLEMQVKYINYYNLDFLATNCALFKKEDEVNLKRINIPPISKKIKKVTLNAMLCRNRIPHGSVVFKKNLAKYDTTRKTQIDYELWLRLLNENEELYILTIPLAFQRIHDRQSFEGKHRLKYTWNATKLQLSFCIKNRKVWPIFYIIAKVFYYILVNRKLKFKFAKIKQNLAELASSSSQER